jgi:hypothetical protein
MFSFSGNFKIFFQNQNIDLTEACKCRYRKKKTEDILNDKEFLKIVTDSKELLDIELLTESQTDKKDEPIIFYRQPKYIIK